MAKFADLHIHSIYSDSDFHLEEIFRKAKDRNLSCISITDHDTIQGLKKAKQLSFTFGIELLEGVELSAQRADVEIHILGYLIDYQEKNLIGTLDNIKDIRKERLLKMVSKLESLGIKIDTQELIEKIKEAVPTRLHVALYMVQKNYVSSIWDAFKKYLSYGKPAYISGFRYSVREVIRIIKEAGGLAFLAHPHFLPDKNWIREFADFGLDGIEVVYPKYSQELILRYKKLADNYGLLKSGGSDCHGSYKEFTSIGQINIPYEWVQKMKDVKYQICHKKNFRIS